MAIAACVHALATETQDIEMAFTHSETQYEAIASFKCQAQSKAALLHLLFDFKNVKEELKDNCEVKMLEDKGDKHLISYRGSFLAWTAESSFERTLDIEKGRIDCKMVKFDDQGILSAPKVLSVSGFWQVKESGDAYIVQFKQTSAVEKTLLASVYFDQAKSDCLRNLAAIKRHIEASFSRGR